MKVKFIPSEEFMRQFKRLAKKYPSLVSDYDTFKKELHENPFQGSDLGTTTQIRSLKRVFKDLIWVVVPVRCVWPLLRKEKARAGVLVLSHSMSFSTKMTLLR